MKHRLTSRLYGVLGIAIALTFVVGATTALGQTRGGTPTPEDPCLTIQSAETQSNGMDDRTGSEATPSPEMQDMGMEAEFDLMFIDMMIPHHQEAVWMAQVVLIRSSNENIRNLAGEVIAAQTAEIEQMTAWRASWYPGAPEVPEDQAMQMMMDMGHSEMMSMETGAMLVDLCDAEDVDVAFLELMVSHHESAIVMGEAALTQTGHNDLRELAEAIVETQSAEIALMQDLLAGLTGTPTAQG